MTAVVDKPELNGKWWRKYKPFLMKSSGLGKALDKYEKRLADFEQKAKNLQTSFVEVETAYGAVHEALTGDVQDKVDEGIKICGSKNFPEVKKTLQNYLGKVIPAQEKVLTNLRDDRKKAYDKWFQELDTRYRSLLLRCQGTQEVLQKTALYELRLLAVEMENYLKVKAYDKKTLSKGQELAKKVEQAQDKHQKMVQEREVQWQKELKLATEPLDEKLLCEKERQTRRELSEQCLRAAVHCKKLFDEFYEVSETEIPNLLLMLKKRVSGTEEAEGKFVEVLDKHVNAVAPLLKKIGLAVTALQKADSEGVTLKSNLTEDRTLSNAKSVKSHYGKMDSALNKAEQLLQQGMVELVKFLNVDTKGYDKNQPEIAQRLKQQTQFQTTYQEYVENVNRVKKHVAKELELINKIIEHLSK